LKEQITIGESSHDPRDQTGEAGALRGIHDGSHDPSVELQRIGSAMNDDVGIRDLKDQRWRSEAVIEILWHSADWNV
jgi:hypothetical protein